MGQSPTLGWLLSCPIRYWWWSLSWELICRNTEFQKQKLVPRMFCVRLHVSRFFLALNGVIWMATWPLWWRMDSVLHFISALCEGGKEAYSFSSSPSGPWLKGFFFFGAETWDERLLFNVQRWAHSWFAGYHVKYGPASPIFLPSPDIFTWLLSLLQIRNSLDVLRISSILSFSH